MAQNHVIGSVNLQVHAGRQIDGFALQQDMSRWFWDEFLPVLDAVLTELAPGDELIRLDKLDIAIPALPAHRWRAELAATLATALRERLEHVVHYPGHTETDSVERIPVAKSHFEAWLYFLQNGRLPSRYPATPEAERLSAVLENVASNAWALAALIHALKRHEATLQRLVYQHDTSFLTRLAEAISGKPMQMLPARQAVLFSLLTDKSFVNFVKTVREQTGGGETVFPAITIMSGRPFEVLFWQEIFTTIAAAPQHFDIRIFEETFFQRAFGDMFHLSFEQLLKSATQLSISRQKGAISTLHRLENIVRKIAKGDDLEIFVQREIRAVLQTQSSEQAGTGEAPLPSSEKQDTTSPDQIPETPEHKKRNTESIQQESIKDDSTLQKTPPLGESSETDSSLSDTSAEGKPEEITPELPFDRKAVEEQKDVYSAKSDASVGTEPKVLYVQNAGLVLLHPFLTRLFEATGIVEAGAFIDDTARARGVQLLYYLAVGDADAPEYELMLPKLLCGMAFDTPLDRKGLLDDEIRREGDNMLQAVIKHWGALGAVSNDSLREGFLQRDGKLSRRDDDWLLQVESKTLDVLLGRLSWGIGIVKLKWMPDIIHVEWY